MSKKTGGAAFPLRKGFENNEGMKLRDWFAGMALQGMLARSYITYESAAEDAYRYADTMLEEREE